MPSLFACKKLIVVSYLVAFSVAFAFANNAEADIILDSGTFDTSNSSTGSFVAATSMFNLNSADIPDVEFEVDFSLIDDGASIVVNGFVLFTAPELSQFGPMEFMPTGVQPNDIQNPWNANNNGLPRLSVFSDAAGTIFSGSTTESASSTVTYLPIFTVEDFHSLLQSGDNTIEIINSNGSGGAAINGEFAVTKVHSIPEPGTALLVAGLTLFACRRRSRVRT